MRVLIAARLSKKSDHGETGLETQTSYTRDWCERQGWTVVGTVGDRISGTSHLWARRNLKPWVTDPEKIAQYDAIVGYRLDRITRGNAAATRALETWADDHGKQLFTEDGLHFPCEGNQGAIWDFAKRNAHEYVMGGSEKVKRNQAEKRAQGYLVGKPPFGYRVTGHRNAKGIAPIPELTPYVVGMFTRYRDGQSLEQICDWLNESGVVSAGCGPWAAKSVSQIIRNRTYAGYRQDASGRTILKCAPMVDSALQNEAIRRLDTNPRGRRGASTRETALLTSVLHCEKCQHAMYRITTRDGDFYRCPNKRTQCRNMIRVDVMDARASAIMSRANEPETKLVIVPGISHEDERAELDVQIRAHAARVLDMDPETWQAELDRLREARSHVDAKPETPAVVERVPTGRTYADAWQAGDHAGKRRMMLGRVKLFARNVTAEDELPAEVGKGPLIRIESDYKTLKAA
jgi:site-specific DNA recombinase